MRNHEIYRCNIQVSFKQFNDIVLFKLTSPVDGCPVITWVCAHIRTHVQQLFHSSKETSTRSHHQRRHGSLRVNIIHWTCASHRAHKFTHDDRSENSKLLMIFALSCSNHGASSDLKLIYTNNIHLQTLKNNHVKIFSFFGLSTDPSKFSQYLTRKLPSWVGWLHCRLLMPVVGP